MKSLEILNQLEEKYHNYVIELYYSTNMSKGRRSELYDMYDNEINKLKQDLEILDILKNDLEMMGFNVVDGEIVIDNADFKYVFQKEYYDVHPKVFKKLLEEKE